MQVKTLSWAASPTAQAEGCREHFLPLEGARRPPREAARRARMGAAGFGGCGERSASSAPTALPWPPASPRALGHSGQPGSAPSVATIGGRWSPTRFCWGTSSVPPSESHSGHFLWG